MHFFHEWARLEFFGRGPGGTPPPPPRKNCQPSNQSSNLCIEIIVKIIFNCYHEANVHPEPHVRTRLEFLWRGRGLGVPPPPPKKKDGPPKLKSSKLCIQTIVKVMFNCYHESNVHPQLHERVRLEFFVEGGRGYPNLKTLCPES